MKRFLVADDHFIVRTGISHLIKEEFMLAKIDECHDGNSTLKKIETTEYDLAILDISMPGTDSISLLRQIFALRPDLKVLILTMSSEDIYAKKYLQLGAKGFVNKGADQAQIRQAITTILHNQRYTSPKLRDNLTQELFEGKTNNPFDILSLREIEVMTHLVEGKNVSKIAELLSLHTSTIGTHKANILEKLGVTNLIELNKIVKLFSIH